MAFSFRTAERARRDDPRAALARREDASLPFVERDAAAGSGLILDTCVYIDQMQGKAPQIVEDLLFVRTVNHSSVVIQELMLAVGALRPEDPRSSHVVSAIGKVIDGMRAHRIHLADLDLLARGAVYAGILSRTQGYARSDRMRALSDCVLFMQAIKLGLTVLTRNVSDFDYLLQMRPTGRVLFYRT